MPPTVRVFSVKGSTRSDRAPCVTLRVLRIIETMRGIWGWVLCLALSARLANAGIAVGRVQSSFDLTVEAAALEWWLGSIATATSEPAPLTVATTKAAGLDASVHVDLRRIGHYWQASLLLITKQKEIRKSKLVLDGQLADVVALVEEELRKVTNVGEFPRLTISEIWPYAEALVLARNGEASTARNHAIATALMCGNPNTALRMPVLQATLREWAQDRGANMEDRLVFARATGLPRDLETLAAEGTTPSHAAARALAHAALLDLAKAEQALQKIAAEPSVLWARAIMNLQAEPAIQDPALTALARAWPEAAVALVSYTQNKNVALMASLKAHVQLASAPCATRTALLIAEATGDASALAAVRTRFLGDPELARLDALLTGNTTNEGNRLRAEVAVRRGDDAKSALATYTVACADEACHLARARWFRSEGRLDEAILAYTKTSAVDEHAEALMVAGRLDESAALAKDPALLRAIELLRATEKKDQAAIDKLAAETRQVAPALAVRKKIGISSTDEAIRLAFISNRTTASVDLDFSDADAAQDVAPTIAVGELGISELMAQIPRAALPLRGTFRIAEMPWEPGLFTLFTADLRSVRESVKLWMEKNRYATVTVAPKPFADLFVQSPPKQLQMEAVRPALADADALVLVSLRRGPQGPLAHIVVVSRGPDDAYATTMVSGRLGNPDLIDLDTGKLVFASLVGLILAGLFVFFIVRGAGVVVVSVKLDPDGSDESLCLVISQANTRPLVSDYYAFHKNMATVGYTKSARASTLVSAKTNFKVPPGTWYVHLYGGYLRAGEPITLTDHYSKPVQVRRGKTQELILDLGSTLAELRVTIQATRMRGNPVWLDNNRATQALTEDNGEVRMPATVGRHTLHFEADGFTCEKQIIVGAPRIERLSFNAERERRLATMDLSVNKDDGPRDEFATPKRKPAPPLDEFGMPLESGRTPLPASGSPPLPGRAPTPPPRPFSTVGVGGPPPIEDGTMPIGAFAGFDPNKILGRYTVRQELGRGAMGVVFHAWDENLERAVAIKQISPELRRVPEAVKLFQTEAKALAQLHHANIVSVFDFVDANEMYLIMEFVEGRTLDDLLEEKKTLPVRQAARVMDQLCAGLAYAHEQRVIHRDIKPANIFVSKKGIVKLGDFGLARVVREVAIRQTEIRGTPLYMAPEQVMGTNVSHRVDLYAAGATFFHMLTGRPPFVDGEVLYHHMNTAPPKLSTLIEADARLEALVDQLLAKDPAARPATALEVRRRLAEMQVMA